MKVLVAYASKYGSTREMAEFIGESLAKRGMDVDVRDVTSVGGVADFDAHVVGSALYMGHWMKEAKEFLKKNRGTLAGRPVWLFSSGPVGIKRTDAKGRDLLEVSGPAELGELRALVNPRDHRVFFGAFDGSRLTGTHAMFYKLASRSKSAREAMPEGDFRDWKEIGAWADSIGESLVAVPA